MKPIADLRQEFVNVYRQANMTNQGLSTEAINKMKRKELERYIQSLTSFIELMKKENEKDLADYFLGPDPRETKYYKNNAEKT